MIWVTGCRGMLGREICEILGFAGIRSIGSDSEVDIGDSDAVARFAEKLEPTWIINCAGYTKVDQAECEPEAARIANAVGPENLGRLAEAHGVPIVHFSTDYVFDGTGTTPWCESDRPNPLSVYGRTKREGEERLVAATSRFFLFRISWLYGQFGPSFVRTILRLLRERDELRVIEDQLGSPTWTSMLARNLTALVGGSNQKYGIYHYADDGVISWHEFATAIRDIGLEIGLVDRYKPILPIPTEAYPLPAPRPKNSAFDKTRVREILHFDLKPWRDNIKRFLTDEYAASKGNTE